jgi:hypothetical protein
MLLKKLLTFCDNVDIEPDVLYFGTIKIKALISYQMLGEINVTHQTFTVL